MTRRTHRRQFLKETAAAGIGFWVAGGVALRESRAANEQVNIACIGIGGKGDSDSAHAAQCGNIVAICDVDDEFIASKKKQKGFEKAKVYNDYRKLFDEMGKEFDAVTVSTPDHHHAVAGLTAMKLGKHLYCQKPLTHTVYEARQMRETATKMKVATQMGNQGTAADGLRRAVEMIQGGAIGAVREAHVWTNRPVWPQAPKVVERPKEDPVPDYLHWEEFIGAAPMRPFSYGGQDPNNKDRKKDHHFAYHAFNWRGWWDFGTGALGDMACHTANMAFMALQLGYPSTIHAESAEINPETYPAWARVTFQFPARESKAPVKFVWYEGHKDGKTVLPAADLVKGTREADKGFSIYFKNDKWWFKKDDGKPKDVSSGSFLIGEKATLFSPDDYGAESYIITEDKIEKVEGKPEKLPSNNGDDLGQKKEWIAAIKGGPKALSNFDYAAMLTETILLGNIAIKLGKKLEWDGPNLKVTNVKEAADLINPPYRKGWSLPV